MATNITEAKDFSSFCPLSTMSESWEGSCTPEHIKTIKNLAQDYINSHPVPSEIRNKFITALIFVNNQYQQNLGIDPFTDEIQQLTNCSPNVKKLATQFESSPRVSPSLMHVKIERTLSPQSIKNRIGKLDLNSPHLNTEIKGIKEDLTQLQKKQLVSSRTYNAFIEALETIRVGYTFNKTDPFFSSLASFFKANFPDEATKKIDLIAYENHKKAQRLKARSDLLQLLKKITSESDDYLTESCETSIHQLTEFKKESLKTFYITLLSQYERQLAFFDPRLTSNFHQLCAIFTNMKEEISELLINQFNKRKEILDNHSNHLFSRLLPTYPFLNCTRPELLSSFVEEYSQLYFTKFWLGGDLFAPENLEEEITNRYNTFVSNHFTSLYEWFAIYGANIVKPYHQLNDLYAETEFGCCFYNCLERHTLILDDPYIESKDIPMQCSPKSRYYHLKTTVASLQAHSYQDEENITQLNQVEGKGVTKFDLKLIDQRIELTETIDAPLADLLFLEIAKLESEQQWVLSILKLRSDTEAHAINVQIDNVTNRYRFIDDNIGICEFADLNSLNTALFQLIKIHYPKMNSCIWEFYEKKT